MINHKLRSRDNNFSIVCLHIYPSCIILYDTSIRIDKSLHLGWLPQAWALLGIAGDVVAAPVVPHQQVCQVILRKPRTQSGAAVVQASCLHHGRASDTSNSSCVSSSNIYFSCIRGSCKTPRLPTPAGVPSHLAQASNTVWRNSSTR